MDMNLGYLISHQISIIAQHNSSRLGFPALITALCKSRGVTSDSRSLESLSPTINMAYIKKNCWNLDDPLITFRGPRKAKGKRSEAPPSSDIPPSTTLSTTVPSSSTVAPSVPAPVPAPAPPTGPSSFPSETLFAMLQSLHRGQLRGQPSPSRGGEAPATQEPVPAEEPMPDVEDEPVPPEPFIFEIDPVA
ncbi:hypothetical protein GmHk_18G051681 [Glycine max]|nr:hypothetical protein GmHk_18G051681 [Glycine max]